MGDLERLGQSDAWGETVLLVLQRFGWIICQRPALGGGVLVIAQRGNVRVARQASTLAAAATPVFHACALHQQHAA